MLSIKGNYLYNNDKPFFWLSDTAWELFKLDIDDIKLYLKNRKSLGYNVIQTILILKYTDKIKTKEYWNYVSKAIDYAKSLDIYMALLPCWGSVIKDGYINKNNIDEYIKFLSSYFKQDNIIWVLGGDIRGDYNLELFNHIGKSLKELNKERLITFHPFGRTGSYLWFNNQDWLDFNMFQSGHRRDDQLTNKLDDLNDESTFGESSYKYVIKNFSYDIKKPCLDSEPSYEGVRQGLHFEGEPYWEAYHIRRYAYFSVFEGSCGHTYGNNAIIQFYNYDGNGNYGVRESWYEALHSPGGAQMQYLKELMESVDYTKGKATPKLILNQYDNTHRISCFSSLSFIFCYTFYGDEIQLDLKDYKNKKMSSYWMNPENNSKSYINTLTGFDSYRFKPTMKKELSNDWVLILIEEI